MGNTIEIKPLNRQEITITVEGVSPLVQKRWSEKSYEEMRRKHAGDKSKNRSVRDMEQECEDATYHLEDGRFGIPAMSFKSSATCATHKDLGLPMTVVRKAMFIHVDGVDRDGTEFVAIETPGPKMREDVVRVGNGATDLRYRPEFSEWRATLRINFDADWLTAESIVNLFERGGFGVGIGENRPQKSGGNWGRYRVVRDA